jgi:hypothetical protein
MEKLVNIEQNSKFIRIKTKSYRRIWVHFWYSWKAPSEYRGVASLSSQYRLALKSDFLQCTSRYLKNLFSLVYVLSFRKMSFHPVHVLITDYSLQCNEY